jgi:hypothetical protein
MNAEARNVSRWRSPDEQPEVIRDRIEWNPAGATRPLAFDLNNLFDEAAWPRQ